MLWINRSAPPVAPLLALAMVLTVLAPAVARPDTPVRTPPQIILPTQDSVEQAARGGTMASPYTKAVALLLGRMYSVEMIVTACSESFPGTREANESAYRAWRKDHRQALQLIERHGDAVILENAHGNSALAKQVKELYRTQALARARRVYGSDTPGVFQAICGQFPQQIRSIEFDFEHNNESDLALLRAHPVPERKP
jgi:hypothetical protein